MRTLTAVEVAELEARVVVGNTKTGVPAGFTAEYVGRPSLLGNPFRVRGKGGTFAQGEAAAAFGPYLRAECRARGAVFRAVVALARRVVAGECIALMCWCLPLPCHAAHLRLAVLGYARWMLEGRAV